MSASIVLRCDGTIGGQRCASFRETGELTTVAARLNAADWRSVHVNPDEPPLEARFIDLCAATRHDQDRP